MYLSLIEAIEIQRKYGGRIYYHTQKNGYYIVFNKEFYNAKV